MNKLRDRRPGSSVAQSRMHSGDLFRTFWFPILATNCVLFPAVLAARILRDDGRNLTQGPPNESRPLVSSRLDLEEYLTALRRLNAEDRKGSRLSMEMEFEMLKKGKVERFLGIFMGWWIGDILSAEAGVDERMEGQKGGKMTRGRVLSKLIDCLYLALNWDDISSKVRCQHALVAHSNLDDAVWEEYADIAVKDIVRNIISREVATSRLWNVVFIAAMVGSIEPIRAIFSKIEPTNIKVDLKVCESAISWAVAGKHHGVAGYLYEKLNKRLNPYEGTALGLG